MTNKKKLVVLEYPTPMSHDSINIAWKDLDTGDIVGGGYKGKHEGAIICIVRCPVCRAENYAINVPTGTCYKCGFDANKK